MIVSANVQICLHLSRYLRPGKPNDKLAKGLLSEFTQEKTEILCLSQSERVQRHIMETNILVDQVAVFSTPPPKTGPHVRFVRP